MAKPRTFVRTYTQADPINPLTNRLVITHNLGRKAPHVAAYQANGAPYSGVFVWVMDDNTCELEGVIPQAPSPVFTATVRVTA